MQTQEALYFHYTLKLFTMQIMQDLTKKYCITHTFFMKLFLKQNSPEKGFIANVSKN